MRHELIPCVLDRCDGNGPLYREAQRLFTRDHYPRAFGRVLCWAKPIPKSRVGNCPGLPWTTIVSVPRPDLMAVIGRGYWR